MLKPMTWAKWIKKIMELLPIETESQHIKDVLIAEILDAVQKRIPKTDLYTAAGCILSQEFCIEAHAEDAKLLPLPVSSPVIDKASDLLKPVKPKRVKAQKPSIDPELCETYDATKGYTTPVMATLVSALQAKVDSENAARDALPVPPTPVVDPVFGVTDEEKSKYDSTIDGSSFEYKSTSAEGISTPEAVTKPKKKKPSKKKKTVVPVTSLADQASDMLSSDDEYNEFKSHLVEVMDGIKKNP